ncbi:MULTISPECIES: PTS sugar transporter subunit IIA [unclassified Legionella]|uniref:PTS sugar transporter subunit IIA n=1 Tax=unclassified Legionella TaxID=2622702 RepID=UPI001E610B7A|nr:PTS sugar transporter subunit IIA [Legionella sp. 31fI33]MCC5013741.1 PTS sugar transporter subunit IIA [Legionella sp. 31fI33]
MQLCHVLNPNSVYIDSTSQSKTAVLLKISQLLSREQPQLDAQDLFDAYWKRECMGSTSIGQGITIPHIRVPGMTQPHACVIRLLNPVDFGATDKQPVDLVVGLVVPQEQQVDQHLQLLASIIKQFSIPSFREACRRMTDSGALYNLLASETVQAEEAL